MCIKNKRARVRWGVDTKEGGFKGVWIGFCVFCDFDWNVEIMRAAGIVSKGGKIQYNFFIRLFYGFTGLMVIYFDSLGSDDLV